MHKVLQPLHGLLFVYLYQTIRMTRIEKLAMAILILAIIGTVVFWKDVRSAFTNNRNKENIVENELEKHKKDSDGDDKKKKKRTKTTTMSRFFFLPIMTSHCLS